MEVDGFADLEPPDAFAGDPLGMMVVPVNDEAELVLFLSVRASRAWAS